MREAGTGERHWLAESAAGRDAGGEDDGDERLTQAVAARHLEGHVYFNATTEAEARPNPPEVGPGAGWPAPQCPGLSSGRAVPSLGSLGCRKATQSPDLSLK